MGLSSKEVSGDQGIHWSQTLLQAGAAKLAQAESIRRQPPRLQQSEPLKCPRCDSTNTKFCYYNNYNKSQPRHFCKCCKRHWTKGGTLRNVPVGGGRKNKRPKISKAATTTITTTVATTASSRQQDSPDFPLSANTGDQKSVSNMLYHALIRSPSPLLHETTKVININSIPGKPFMGSNGVNAMNSAGLNVSAPQNPNIEVQFSSLSAFESTVTTVNIPSSSGVPWPCPDTSGTLDLPNYWNWSYIDFLNPADLNISWDDDENPKIIF